jgi:large conductance mechanosensitive channel
MNKILEDFKNFIMRGNVVDMAVGIIIGGAFGTIVKSLVDDIIMPPVGLLLGNADFADLFMVLREGEQALPPYSTVAQAQEAGAVTWNYGIFINNVVSFLIVALAVFMLVRMVNQLHEVLDDDEPQETAEPTEKDCPYCFKVIPIDATRCPFCTSQLEGQPAGA